MNAANRVMLNTAALYTRMAITMVISLFSTRLILDALGNTDFGIFNLIAGVILMLSFLNNAMATSTQRFLSYHQGKNDLSMQRRVFTNSMVLHIAIGLVIVIVLEVIGFFIFDGFLNIPENRINQAKVVYHFMSATVFFTVINVPFNGSLVAHENLLWVAIVNVIESLLKLSVALLLYVVVGDKLVVYGLLMACITVVSFILYAAFCLRKYPECTFKGLWNLDIPLIRLLSSFAGWNLLGALAGLGRNQGLAVILNIFLGATVNAAYGIANQVSAQLQFFSTTLLRALNPQIMKSEGAGDRERMLRLSMMASKFAFFLMSLFAIPCIFEIHAILSLWLKDTPPYTEMFCVLTLLTVLSNQLTIGLQSAVQATGFIKYYQLVVSTVLFLNLPIAYLLLRTGFPPFSVLVGSVTLELLACVCRLWFARKLAGLSIRLYFRRVLGKELVPILLAAATAFFISRFFHFDYRFLVTSTASALVYLLAIYLFGLCQDEKLIVNATVDKLKGKLASAVG